MFRIIPSRLLTAPKATLTGDSGSTATLQIEGLVCSACAANVRARLLAVRGVRHAEVDLESGHASVEHDASCSPGALVAAVERSVLFPLGAPDHPQDGAQRMKVGAHVGSSGGLTTAFERAAAIGAETIQIFGAPPQQWRRRKIREEECAAFKDMMAEVDIQPVFIHGTYLINLATAAPDQLDKSTEALTGDLNLASAIGAKGVIFHVGSHKGVGFEAVLSQICDALAKVLESTPDDAWIILENSAGMGGSVGSKFPELGAIIKTCKSDRLRVCIDTEHAYAAGYDLADAKGIESAMAEFDREVGLDRLVAVHANDSKIPLGGGVDRHDNIGEGHIGRKGFEVIMAHTAFAEVPFLLEVPGFDKEGPDKPNVDALKEIRAKVGKKKPAKA